MSDHHSDPFFQYATTSFGSSCGDIALPMFFYDAASHFALFYVDLEKARALTADHDLEPVEFHKGKALVAIASFDYRKASIDPYLEVGLAIACTPKGVTAPADPAAALLGDTDSHSIGFFVADLPVSTEQARLAGIELWGFPKFTADITFKLDGDRFEGSVADPDGTGPIFALSGEALGGATLPAISMVYYTRFNGKTLRIHSIVRGAAKYALPGSMKLSVGDSQHQLARHLVALGLDGAAPDVVFYSNDTQLRLMAGAPLA